MKTISKGKVTKIALLSALVVLLSVCVSMFAYQITPVKAEAAESTEEPQITLVGANVSLKDSVSIVYAAAVKGYDYTKYKTKLIVWKNPQEDYTIENALKIIEENKKKSDSDGEKEIECVIVDSSYHATLGDYSCDMFYYGMPAKNIVDQLYVRAYVEVDGNAYYSDTTKYSLLEYLYDQLAKSGLTDYQRRMYEIILKYGGRAQDLFDYWRHRRADDTFYSIHVENGTFADGFTRGMFLEGEEVVMKANAAPEGKKFAYWQDMNGIILGYEEILTVKATSANIYTAVFVNKITVAEQLHLKASVAYDDDISAVDLPDIIEIKDDAGEITSSIKVTWDKTQFVKGQIGDQVLTATPADDKSEALLGNDTVTMTVTVMPYTFEVDTVTGNYHITKYCGSEAKVSIPEEYRGKPVDTINYLAFSAATSITELYIPDTITKIEKNAFNACDNIETIRIPFIGDSLSTSNIFGYIFGTDSYEMQKSFVPVNLHKVIISDQVLSIRTRAFEGCSQIDTVVIPNQLQYIYDYAFRGTSISEFTIPDTMIYIRSSFDGCDRLQKVYVSSLNKLLSMSNSQIFGPFPKGDNNPCLYVDGKKAEIIDIPAGVTVLRVFSGFSGIRKITIPDSVTDMDFAFYGCKDLEEVVFAGKSQIKQFNCTFTNCTSLKTITIPKSIKELWQDVFEGCLSLKTAYYEGSFEEWCDIKMQRYMSSPMPCIEKFYYKKENVYEELIDAVIPETITQINVGVFSGYKALRGVTLHEGVTAIAKNAFQDCVNLSSIKLPSQLKFIGEYAFYGCKSLYSINIPKYVSEIENYTFGKCSSLTTIVIPENVTAIGDSAFSECESLANIIISKNVTKIGRFAFSYCSNLTSVVIGENVSTISTYAFNGCSKLTSVEFKNPEGWNYSGTAISADDLRNPETAAKYLATNYYSYAWAREDKGE